MMIDRALFINMAVDNGFNFEYADSKVDAYLDSCGGDAIPESFVQWLINNVD